MPSILACQPEGAAPLVATERSGATTSQAIADPFSLAASTCEARTGWHATAAIRNSGAAVAVTEGAIRKAFRDLAAQGFFVEPASAVALAGLRQAQRQGLAADGVAVCISTSSGQNWAADTEAMEGTPSIIPTLEDLERLADADLRAIVEAD
jgi:threonine synthase